MIEDVYNDERFYKVVDFLDDFRIVFTAFGGNVQKFNKYLFNGGSLSDESLEAIQKDQDCYEKCNIDEKELLEWVFLKNHSHIFTFLITIFITIGKHKTIV